MGFFAGLAAFVLSSRFNSAEAVAGTGYELTVIAPEAVPTLGWLGALVRLLPPKPPSGVRRRAIGLDRCPETPAPPERARDA